jgi:hypothetical protein
MRKSVIAGLALWATLSAFAGKVHAEVNYSWCIIGDTRAIDCYFSTREQCMQDGRNRGFGSQCIENPYYKPGAPTVSGNRPTVSQTPRRAARQRALTCTRIKSSCYTCNVWGDTRVAPFPSLLEKGLEQFRPRCEQYCNFTWERCMKTGWWEGAFFSGPAERR